jgi:hypothetical protein
MIKSRLKNKIAPGKNKSLVFPGTRAGFIPGRDEIINARSLDASRT